MQVRSLGKTLGEKKTNVQTCYVESRKNIALLCRGPSKGPYSYDRFSEAHNRILASEFRAAPQPPYGLRIRPSI